MKINDEVIDAMIRAGLIKAFGGSDDEIQRVVTTVGGCDEAIVTLRREGAPVGVLVVADDAQASGATARGHAALEELQKQLN